MTTSIALDTLPRFDRSSAARYKERFSPRVHSPTLARDEADHPLCCHDSLRLFVHRPNAARSAIEEYFGGGKDSN
jgi:hypothetical protein